MYPIEVTPLDAMAQQEVFYDEFADLLGCEQLTIFPPFPDYSLLSQSRVPKVLLKAINEVVLSRRSSFVREHGWLRPYLRSIRCMWNPSPGLPSAKMCFRPYFTCAPFWPTCASATWLTTPDLPPYPPA